LNALVAVVRVVLYQELELVVLLQGRLLAVVVGNTAVLYSFLICLQVP
jgi:hypothetical protein